MKIQSSVRAAFDAQKPINQALQLLVDEVMRNAVPRRWHYESRLKEIESFSVKIETGRVGDPNRLEDFLACTLVVPNSADIDAAIKLVRSHFKIKYRRPKNSTETSKSADAFPFDDLRLYVIRGSDPVLPAQPTDQVLFEIQIKTFLQHAWGIATHDFNYKTDEVSWGKDRVVAHLKAALEHVELSLREAHTLSSSSAVALINPQFELITKCISLLKNHWRKSELPHNLRSSATSISELLRIAGVSPDEIDSMLTDSKNRHGQLPLNLSPYGTILNILIETRPAQLDKALSASKKGKILITPELSLPPNFPSPSATASVIRL